MKGLFKSFQDALNGIWAAISAQTNLRIHLAIAVIVLGGGLYFRIAGTEWLAVVLAIGLVLSMELMNTAIEHVVNLASPQHQPIAGKIKDIAAGAVLISAVASAIIGLIIFSKYVFE